MRLGIGYWYSYLWYKWILLSLVWIVLCYPILAVSNSTNYWSLFNSRSRDAVTNNIIIILTFYRTIDTVILYKVVRSTLLGLSWLLLCMVLCWLMLGISMSVSQKASKLSIVFGSNTMGSMYTLKNYSITV